MALYMYQGTYAAGSVAAQIREPHDRVEAVRPAPGAMGGTIVAAGCPFGGYGAVVLLEVPDDITATGIGLAIAAGGAFSPAATITRLLTSRGCGRVVTAGAAAGQRGHGGLLPGWYRRLPAISHGAAAGGAAARSAGSAAGPAAGATIMARAIRRAGRLRCCANPAGAAVPYDQNCAAAAGSEE